MQSSIIFETINDKKISAVSLELDDIYANTWFGERVGDAIGTFVTRNWQGIPEKKKHSSLYAMLGIQVLCGTKRFANIHPITHIFNKSLV